MSFAQLPAASFILLCEKMLAVERSRAGKTMSAVTIRHLDTDDPLWPGIGATMRIDHGLERHGQVIGKGRQCG